MKYSDKEWIARKLFDWPTECDGSADHNGHCVRCNKHLFDLSATESTVGKVRKHHIPLPNVSLNKLIAYLKDLYPFEYIETFYKNEWRVRITPKHQTEVYMNWDRVDRYNWAIDYTLEDAFIKAIAMYLRHLKC